MITNKETPGQIAKRQAKTFSVSLMIFLAIFGALAAFIVFGFITLITLGYLWR